MVINHFYQSMCIDKLPITYLIIFLVMCSFPRKMKTMTRGVTTVPESLKEPGGTGIVTAPTLMVYISTDHILRLPMGSTGKVLRDIIIHLNVLK